MNKKIINGVMTAQLLLMAGVAWYNIDTISRKNAEIENKNMIIAQLREQNESNKDNIKKMIVEIDEKHSKIQEKDKEITSLMTTITDYENKITELENKLKQEQTVLYMEASAYTNHPSENGGTYGGKVVTKSGYDISNTITYKGMGIVASDPRVIPMYSIIEIEGLKGQYIVLDTGGAIKGKKLDVLMSSSAESNKWGRKMVKVKIVRRG